MAKFEVGDKVLVEAEITDTSHGEPKYYVKTEWGTNKWAYEREIHPMDAKTYEDGMNEAWEIARRIMSEEINDGYSGEELIEIFGAKGTCDGCDGILKRHTAAEAAEKIAAWEESRKIHVGDVVEVGKKGTESYIGTAVITNVYADGCYLVFGDGESMNCGSGGLTKTGRHIDIAGLLAQIGGNNGQDDD